MTIHSAGNLLVRTLRFCSFLSRRCALTGVRSHATIIQTYRFVPLKGQNGIPYWLGNCLDLKSNRFHSSEKTEYQNPTAVLDTEPQDGSTYSREISGVSAPSISNLSKTTISENLEPLEEEFITEQKSLSSATRIKPLEQFLGRLQTCTSPSDVLDLYKESTMTWKQVSSCLMTMWKTTKRMSEDQKRYERKLMFEHPVFEKICQQTLREAQLMSCIDLSYSLFALVKIGVSQNSRLIHTLLRLTQERLNKFDERALSVLSSCLKNMEDSRSVNALRVGLRLLVELRIPTIRRVMALQTMMRCIGQGAPLPLKKKLENKALSLLNEFTLPNCQYMFVTLAVMDYRSLPLLEACSNRIIENIHSIPFWCLVHVLQSCKDLWYRNPALLSAIGNHVLSSLAIWQVKQLILFLVLFSELNFRHIELMNAFAHTMLANSESLTLKDVLSVLRVYSLLNHRPDEGLMEQFLQTLSDVFELYLSKCSSLELLRGVYSLCLMGHYPQAALNQLFQDDILNELCSSGNVYHEANEQMLQGINLCLELENPSFLRHSDNHNAASPSLSSHPVNAELQKTVDTILGDSSLYQQGVLLKNYHFIDYTIAFDQKSKNLVPIPQDDEIASESNVQRVAVLHAPGSAFCFGTAHPKDRLAMRIRHLKLLGYHVVLVSEHEFAKLSEDDRVGFLKSAIFAE